jgi:hypothetical protein
MVIVIVSLFGAPGFAVAQTATAAPPHIPLQKTIAQAGPDIIPH